MCVCVSVCSHLCVLCAMHVHILLATDQIKIDFRFVVLKLCVYMLRMRKGDGKVLEALLFAGSSERDSIRHSKGFKRLLDKVAVRGYP